MTDIAEEFRRAARFSELGDALANAGSLHDWFNAIRGIYAEAMPRILDGEGCGVDPYFVDWIPRFTPIEDAAWQSIRGQGVPLYPQFPVLHYFLDFGDPIKRVGLEVDGRHWHNKDKDYERDMVLWAAGWSVFRVTGTEANASIQKPEEQDRIDEDGNLSAAMREWLFHSADGVVSALNNVYFRGSPNAYGGAYLQTLNAHRLAHFPIHAELA